MNYLEFFVILSPKVRLDKVVSHRVCLDQVCLRSDDAKLMDNLMSYVKIIIFCLSGQQNGRCRRVVLQQYGSPNSDSQRFSGIVIMTTPFAGQYEQKQ